MAGTKNCNDEECDQYRGDHICDAGKVSELRGLFMFFCSVLSRLCSVQRSRLCSVQRDQMETCFSTFPKPISTGLLVSSQSQSARNPSARTQCERILGFGTHSTYTSYLTNQSYGVYPCDLGCSKIYSTQQTEIASEAKAQNVVEL